MLRVRTVLTGLAGAPYLSTMYFNENNLSANPAQAAVTAVGVFWNALDDTLPAALSWATEAEVAHVDEATGDVTSVDVTTPVTGSGSINAVLHSPAVQGLIRWQTGAFINGRRIQGRTFIPGMSNSTSTSSGTPTSTFQTLMTNTANTLAASPLAPLIIWSRTNGAVRDVTGGSGWGQFAVLRSRRD